MEQINFKEKETVSSQQTIVLILKNYKYFFQSISEYDNNNFKCMIMHEEPNLFFKLFSHFGYKGQKNRVVMSPLMLCTYTTTNNEINELMVFTQEDVKKIISDVPENYIGEKVL